MISLSVGFTTFSDAAFDRLAVKLEEAGVRINCFGSAIGNWSQKIDEPFDRSLAEFAAQFHACRSWALVWCAS